MREKVVLVTGAFGNLGREVISGLAANGARPVAIDYIAGKASTDDRLTFAPLDCTSIDAVTDVVQRTLDKLGRIDGLVNVAGAFRWEKLEDGSRESWDRLYTANLLTVMVMSRVVTPALKASSGAIVNIGAAAAAAKATAGMGPYTATKAGVAKITEALADELKDHGVRVNAVLPSIIDTPQSRVEMPDADFTRWVTPEALTDVVLFLLSDRARAVTGALVPVTGRC